MFNIMPLYEVGQEVYKIRTSTEYETCPICKGHSYIDHEIDNKIYSVHCPICAHGSITVENIMTMEKWIIKEIIAVIKNNSVEIFYNCYVKGIYNSDYTTRIAQKDLYANKEWVEKKVKENNEKQVKKFISQYGKRKSSNKKSK